MIYLYDNFEFTLTNTIRINKISNVHILAMDIIIITYNIFT